MNQTDMAQNFNTDPITDYDFDAAKALEGTYFYDLEYKKDTGVTDLEITPEEYISRLGYTFVKPLQYVDKDTLGFSVPRMFLVTDQSNNPLKARICSSSDEAMRIMSNYQFISARKSQELPKTVSIHGNIIILPFTQGEKIDEVSEEIITQIGDAHRRLLYAFPDLSEQCTTQLLVLLQRIEEKVKSSFQVKHIDEKIEEIKANIPVNILPVFDHQDIGIHNLIKSITGITFVDEEAFGIVPFGYTFSRILYGRSAYGLCRTNEERQLYLSRFEPQIAKYGTQNIHFWTQFYYLRGAARALVVENNDLARRNIEMLFEN